MIAENIHNVQTVIAQACERAGRPVETATLVAVCKTKPAQAVLEAYAAGVRHFGENRVEEANPKIAAVDAAVDAAPVWHMIGHIQSRKARDVVAYEGERRCGLVHSVDDLPLAERFSRLVTERMAEPLHWLAQVNVSGEASKSGFEGSGWRDDRGKFGALAEQIKKAAALPGLMLDGLMTMAPIADDAEAVRPVFRELRLLRDELQQTLGVALPELSMGMTDDYPVAIEEGATLVRVGRAIFGER
jgi:pyridoxal phosphate enzyme (YggS family)